MSRNCTGYSVRLHQFRGDNMINAVGWLCDGNNFLFAFDEDGTTKIYEHNPEDDSLEQVDEFDEDTPVHQIALGVSDYENSQE